jgi:hypothetical protein
MDDDSALALTPAAAGVLREVAENLRGVVENLRLAFLVSGLEPPVEQLARLDHLIELLERGAANIEPEPPAAPRVH